MERSNNGSVGVLAVCAVSWSVALIALQAHKRLLSDFMKKIDSELHGGEKCDQSCKVKKVRFAEDVVEPSSDNKEYRRRRRNKGGGTRSSCIPNGNGDGIFLIGNRMTMQEEDRRLPFNGRLCSFADDQHNNMPLNRQVLYRGIIEHRMLKAGHNLPRHFY
ncbi:uncharacterized protein LOC116207722 isoform X2 [Punica granatum]|uniref:Uncharacterized protein LOC116207722 isoform X2 n=2 Tax=Punica granatum TaxID=22663 RepID=A0A6P8DQL0_PUNGR|nr:uncharacterized protein LOC116207722 isoform X2 [Punica granatum]PKI35277.1 hypothetical protein CRG98_044291 [Punica granatum]